MPAFVHPAAHDLSPNDSAVLALVQTAAGPLSAYDIIDKMRPARPRIAPPTVYRALHRLVSGGLVQRIESLNAWVPRSNNAPAEGGIITICDDCGTVGEYAAPEAMAAISGALGPTGFHPGRPVIEVHGRCNSCEGVAA